MLERDERQNTVSDPVARQLIDQSNLRNAIMNSQTWEEMRCQLREHGRQLQATKQLHATAMAEMSKRTEEQNQQIQEMRRENAAAIRNTETVMAKRTEEQNQQIQELRRENAAAIRNNETVMTQLYGLVEAMSNRIEGLSRERSPSATATPSISQETVLELRWDLAAQKQQFDVIREEMKQQGAVSTELYQQMMHNMHNMTKELHASRQECREMCQRITTYTHETSAPLSGAAASDSAVIADSSQRLARPGPVVHNVLEHSPITVASAPADTALRSIQNVSASYADDHRPTLSGQSQALSGPRPELVQYDLSSTTSTPGSRMMGTTSGVIPAANVATATTPGLEVNGAINFSALLGGINELSRQVATLTAANASPANLTKCQH